MLLFVAFFESSLGPVCWIYAGETTTDKGVGLVVMVNWVLSAIIGIVFLFMSSSSGLGMPLTFFIFGVFCVCSLLFVIFFVVETKGRTWKKVEDSPLNLKELD